MAEVDALLLSMAADLRRMRREIDGGADHYDRKTRQMEKRTRELEREFEKLGASLGRGLKTASVAASVAFGAIVGYSIKAAASATELKNAFEIAFGAGAKGAEAYAKALSEKVGRSQLEVMESMTRFRLLLKNQDAKIAEDLTQALQERAIDVGSLFNLKDAEVVQKFFSGLSGEAEPLKALGVNLNEAALKAELLRLGFKGNTTAAPEAAKQIARANLILRETQIAAGDAAKTIDSTANRFKKLQGETRDAAAQFGEQFLPIANKVLAWATEALTEFNKLPQGMQLAGLAALGLVAASGPLVRLAAGLSRLITLAKEARTAMLGLAAAEVAVGAAGGGALAGAGAGAAAGAGLAAAGSSVAAGAAVLSLSGDTRRTDRKSDSQTKLNNLLSREAAIRKLIARYEAEGADIRLRSQQKALGKVQEQIKATKLAIDVEKTFGRGAAPGTAPGAAPKTGKPAEFALSEALKKAIGGDSAKTGKSAAEKAAEKAAREAERLADQRLAQEDRLNAALAAAGDDLLAARLSQATEAEERLRLELEAIDNERRGRQADLRLAASKEELSAADAILVDMAEESVRREQERVVRERAAEQKAREAQQLREADIEAQIALASLAGSLATTAVGRRDAELRILALTLDLEKARLEEVLASKASTEAEKEIARRRLAALPGLGAAQAAGIAAANRGPLDQLRADMPASADEINEQLERIQAQGLRSLEDGLVGVVTHTQKLGDVFRQVANQIIADLARIAIQKAIIGPVLNALTGGGGGVLSTLASVIGGGRAAGGPVMAGKLYPVGERGPELFAPGVSGAIIPNHLLKGQGGGGVTVVQPLHLDARGAIMTREFVEGINRQMDQKAIQAGQAAASIALRGVPGRIRQFQLHGG